MARQISHQYRRDDIRNEINRSRKKMAYLLENNDWCFTKKQKKRLESLFKKMESIEKDLKGESDL